MFTRGFIRATSVCTFVFLAACNSGSNEGTSATTGTSGGTGTSDTIDLSGFASLFDPNASSSGSAPTSFPSGTSEVWVARVQEISGLAENFQSALSSPPSVPTTGSANFSGAGVIVDTQIPADVDTLAEIAQYAAVATDATASINFGTGDVTAEQFDFVDVNGASVPGSINYAGTLDSSGFTTNTSAGGSIAGTTVSATGDDNAGIGYIGGSQPTAFGFFVDTGSGGTYNGVELGGGFFAAQD